MTGIARSRIDDLRGIAGLSAHALEEVSTVVEGVHQAVLGTLGFPATDSGGTRGLTGLVYRGVRGTTRAVATALDRLLRALPAQDATDASSARRDGMLAVLNGVLGDRLAGQGNPLAIPMTLRLRDAALDLPQPVRVADARDHVLLLVHGLCMSDLHWSTREGAGHGEALSAALDATQLRLRYNSGQHVSQNGRQLAVQLEQLLAAWPVPLQRLTVLAHSMGGLVLRSAMHYALQAGAAWPSRLHAVVFLGTPHHGAPLERTGHLVDRALQSSRFALPFARLGALRSAGITDLHHGNVLDEDWQGRDRFRNRLAPAPLPLPRGVRCHAIAATLGAARGPLSEQLVGDGLVPVCSALGQHADPQRTLAIPRSRQHVATHTGHLELLSKPAIEQRLLRWLAHPIERNP